MVDQLIRELNAQGHRTEARETKPPGSTCPLDRDPDDRQSILVVVGGDGTMRFLAAEAQRFKAVAFLGQGTANVLSIEFGLPRQAVPFTRMLQRAELAKHRHGRIDDSLDFLMMWSAGIDAEVLRRTTQRLKNRIHKAAFVVAGIKACLSYSFPRFQVRCDDQPAMPAHWAIVSRIQHYGGRFRICAQAPDPEQLAVLVYQRPGRWAALTMFWSIATGRIDHNPGFVRMSASRVRLAYPHSTPPCQMDGDVTLQLAHEIVVADTATSFLRVT